MRFTISTFLVLLTSYVAFASELPRLDVELSCRAAPRLLPQDPNPYEQCMRDENAARSELEQRWAGFSPEHRKLCLEEASEDGTPSYVEALTCLEMYAADNASPRRARPRQ